MSTQHSLKEILYSTQPGPRKNLTANHNNNKWYVSPFLVLKLSFSNCILSHRMHFLTYKQSFPLSQSISRYRRSKNRGFINYFLLSLCYTTAYFQVLIIVNVSVNFGGLLLQALLEHWSSTHRVTDDESSENDKAAGEIYIYI